MPERTPAPGTDPTRCGGGWCGPWRDKIGDLVFHALLPPALPRRASVFLSERALLTLAATAAGAVGLVDGLAMALLGAPAVVVVATAEGVALGPPEQPASVTARTHRRPRHRRPVLGIGWCSLLSCGRGRAAFGRAVRRRASPLSFPVAAPGGRLRVVSRRTQAQTPEAESDRTLVPRWARLGCRVVGTAAAGWLTLLRTGLFSDLVSGRFGRCAGNVAELGAA